MWILEIFFKTTYIGGSPHHMASNYTKAKIQNTRSKSRSRHSEWPTVVLWSFKSSGTLRHVEVTVGLHDTEDEEGTKPFRNVRNLSPHNMTSHTTRLEATSRSLWETRVSHVNFCCTKWWNHARVFFNRLQPLHFICSSCTHLQGCTLSHTRHIIWTCDVSDPT